MAMSAHQFRVTKYDPNLREEGGAYMGDDWTSISDIGQTFSGRRLTLADYLDIEANHLTVLASFIEEARVEFLTEGALTDAQKRGWLAKLYEKLRPF